MPLASAGGAGTSILFLVLMFGAFYLLLIRPQQRRAKQQRTMQRSLEIGDVVRTMGGFQVTIVRFDDDVVTVEIAPGVEARIVRQAVASKVTVPESESAEEIEQQERD